MRKIEIEKKNIEKYTNKMQVGFTLYTRERTQLEYLCCIVFMSVYKVKSQKYRTPRKTLNGESLIKWLNQNLTNIYRMDINCHIPDLGPVLFYVEIVD